MKKLGGDLAEFGKKRNTDYDSPPPLYAGGKQQSWPKTSIRTKRNQVGSMVYG